MIAPGRLLRLRVEDCLRRVERQHDYFTRWKDNAFKLSSVLQWVHNNPGNDSEDYHVWADGMMIEVDARLRQLEARQARIRRIAQGDAR